MAAGFFYWCPMLVSVHCLLTSSIEHHLSAQYFSPLPDTRNLNLANATATHTQWKTKFRAANAKQTTMDAATIGADNCCELGE